MLLQQTIVLTNLVYGVHQQYDQTYGNAYEQYEELSSDILPGASTSGVICFGKLDPAQFKLHMEGSSDNYDIDFAPFELDLAQ